MVFTVQKTKKKHYFKQKRSPKCDTTSRYLGDDVQDDHVDEESKSKESRGVFALELLTPKAKKGQLTIVTIIILF